MRSSDFNKLVILAGLAGVGLWLLARQREALPAPPIPEPEPEEEPPPEWSLEAL